MSGGELIEYINSEEEDYSSSSMLRDRRHQGLLQSIEQRRLELEADGIQEVSGMGAISSQRHAEERKEARVERRGESQRIMRVIKFIKTNFCSHCSSAWRT